MVGLRSRHTKGKGSTLEIAEEGITWYRFAMAGIIDPADPLSSFIAIWISFNAWYENNLPGEREWRRPIPTKDGRPFITG